MKYRETGKLDNIQTVENYTCYVFLL